MGRPTVRPEPIVRPELIKRPQPTGTACSSLSLRRIASTIRRKGSSSHLQGKQDPPDGGKAALSRNGTNVIGWGFIRAYYDIMIL